MGPSDNNTNLEPKSVDQEAEQPVVATAPEMQTPASVGSSPQQPMATLPVKKSKKGLIIGIVVAAFLALGLGTAAIVYAFVYNSPENAVADAFSKALSAKSGSADGHMTITQGGTTTKVQMKFATNEQNQAQADLDITVPSGGREFNIKGQFAGTKDSTFIKVNNLKSLLAEMFGASDSDAIEQYYGSLLGKIDNKWVEIKLSDIEEMNPGSTSDKQAQCMQDEIVKFRSDAGLRNEVMDVYKKNQLFKVESKGSDADGNRYSLTPDKEKGKAFSKAIQETKIFKAIDNCYDGELKKSMEKESTSTSSSSEPESYSFDIWVDGFSHNINKFSVVAKDKSSEMTTEFKTKFNNNPSVTIPKGETSMDDIKKEIEDIQKQMMSSYSASGTYESNYSY